MGVYMRKSDLIGILLDDGHLVVTGDETAAELDRARVNLNLGHECRGFGCRLTYSHEQILDIKSQGRRCAPRGRLPHNGTRNVQE